MAEIEDMDMPTKIQTGVLYANKEPEYIVEVIEEHGKGAEYVTVFAAHKPPRRRGIFADDSSEERDIKPRKAYEEKEYNVGRFRETTTLGRLAAKNSPPVKQKVQEDKPPLFMAEIVSGVDTMTGREGLGFYEREKDKITVTGKGVVREHGKKTGVFISLGSIVWDNPKVPTEGVVEDYLAQKYLYIG